VLAIRKEVGVREALALLELCGHGSIYTGGEDYRVGATIDFAHDPADAARRLACPMLVL